MITEVDDALRALVRAALGEIDVAFDAPTKDWAARRNAPTVDVYLYDVREDVTRRSHGVIPRRGPDGTVIGRADPPRHFRLSYLVTAWTQRPEDEHRLLDQVLAALIGLDMLPPEHVVGSLAEAGGPVPVTVGMPPAEDRSVTDVWSSLGGELKPSVEVAVTAPLLRPERGEVGPPVREELLLAASSTLPDGGADPRRRRHRRPS
ncbi:DUF4255 domain-containing protein [Cellulosimicrobium marinum]|uniref:DUF4255 domain-containing protein n=1 Tax=Cellulosimicrobium marinum TaxID=1638992 RepID=UPI001E2ABFC3|nr:DUF4255 domain-containing protein [Cellulosimicrobium marinum]MCB7135686.1 DUF4255 domain-containing protein [Cellulosimicrobium marinum]